MGTDSKIAQANQCFHIGNSFMCQFLNTCVLYCVIGLLVGGAELA